MMDLSKLHEPFPAADVEWRLQTCGKNGSGFWARALAYITNRAIMERLDEVCGPASWRNEFTAGPHGGVICGISIRVEPGEWVTKWDGAENTDIEAVKGGLSGAMKRAAVQWGIGRYLYNLEEGWATCYEDERKGAFRGATKDKDRFSWDAPTLPAWALPGGDGKPGATTQTAKPANTTPTPEQRKMYEKPAPSPEPVGRKDSNVFDLDAPAKGKKANGKTWRELIADAADGRGYVRWCIANMAVLDQSAKEALQLAMTAAELGDPDFSGELHASPLPASV